MDGRRHERRTAPQAHADSPRIWLDAELRLLEASPPARRLLDENGEVLQAQLGQVLRTPRQPGRLGQAAAELLAQLQQAGTAAAGCARPQPPRPQPSKSLALNRAARPPLTLRLQLLRAERHSDHARWQLQLADPSALRLDRRALQQLFELTPTEARIAAGLAEGWATDTLALELGVQRNTVQSHVKRLLEKTGTSQQSQLVGLLWRTVAVQLRESAAAPGSAEPPLDRGLRTGSPAIDLARLGKDSRSAAEHTA